MSLERRLGLGLCSLGVGQALLAVSTGVGSGGGPLELWTTACLAGSSFGLGALLVTGRLPLEGTSGQRRAVRFLGTASIVGGLCVTLVALILLVDHFVG